jgi:hypothetical protein
LAAASLLTAYPTRTAAQLQAGEALSDALAVFLDCNARNCDSRSFRTEITFVNWVRDQEDADVYVIMTSEGTGGGGQQYFMDFNGLDDLEGVDDRLTYTSNATDTRDETILGISGVLAVGLAHYSAHAGYSQRLSVVPTELDTPRRPDLPPGLQGEVDDPWDYWVFTIGGNGSYNAEESRTRKSVRTNFSANRTTEIWKVSLRGDVNISRDKRDLSTGVYSDDRTDWNLGGSVIYSVAEHWSAGVEAAGNSTTRFNQERAAAFGGGLEYSVFPYEESVRRRLSIVAKVTGRYFKYEEETVFNKTEEVRPEGALSALLSMRQPWGDATFNASATAYLDQIDQSRLSMGGRLSVRIFRGLEWNINGSIASVNNQIYLPLEDISDEDILVSRRQLPTDFTYDISTGLSFRFGSIYNNVVNNRYFSFSGMEGFFRGRR